MACAVASDTAAERCAAFDLLCWRVLIWVLGFSTPLLAALKPRRFLVGELDFLESGEGIAKMATQGLYLFFLAFCCLVLVRRLCRLDRQPEPRAARRFWLLSVLLAVMPTLSSLLLGGEPAFGIVATIAIYSATFFLPAPPVGWLIGEVRLMLLALYVYGSLLAALLVPQWAWNLQYAEESATAVLPIRLFGTANHANALAPLAIFAWMLGRFPGGRFSGERCHGAAALAVLLLTQSKTNWAIALLLAGVYGLGKLRSLGRFKRYLVYLTAATLASGALLFVVKFSPYAARIAEMIRDPQVVTLTGRLPLWLFAVEIWLKQPWLGQGLEGWSSQALLDLVDLLGWAAPNAHNQALQVLSQAGLLGLAVMVLWALSYLAIARQTPQELRLPLCWLSAFFLLPGFTEVILQYGLGPGTTVLTWIASALVLVLAKRYSAP